MTGIDEAALAPFIKGEESLLEEYDAAITEASGSAAAGILQWQRGEVVAMVEAMRALKD